MRSYNDFPVFISGIPSYNNWVKMNEFHAKYKRGDYVNIADKTGYSTSYVWRVLNAERGQNKAILSEARKTVARRVSPFMYMLK